MEGLCWSRGALGISMLLLLAVALSIPSTTHSLSIRNANGPGPSGAGMPEQLILPVQLGSQVSFNCTNASSIRFVWYDGVLLLNSSQPLHGVTVIGVGGNNVTIDIPNILSYHYGNYKCFNSETGQLQATVTLLPNVPTPSDLIVERLIKQRGDVVLIRCGPGESLVKVDGKFNHSVVPGSLLEVNSTDHQGKYLCLRRDNYPVKIYYVQLSGYHPLKVTIRPRRIQQSVPPDQNVDCLVTGGPGPFTISWYYNATNGRSFSTSGRIHVEHIGSINGYDDGLRLILNSSLPEHDSGVYICVAETEWEKVEQSIEIDLTNSSEIYIAYWPKTTLAVGGSDISIMCYAVSRKLDTELTFAFRKGNTTLQPGPTSRLNDYVTNSSMVLRNVTQSDNGVYSCQLLHLVKSDWRNGTLVVYEDPLHVLSFISNKSADNSFNLTCNITIHEDFSERLIDIRVMFKLNNHTIAPDTFTAGNNISAFHTVTDSGLYHCIATIDGVSKSLSVNIKGSEVSKNGSDGLRNILLTAMGVVALLCVMLSILLFTICCRCPQKLGMAGYSNMLSKTKIGARLSTNSCASADFVFKKSSSKSSLLATSEWAIPYDSLKFDCSLGSGAFGTVRKAYMMTGIGQRTPVAVKTLQCGGDEISSREAFEKEVMILHRVGSHQHIIGLYGVCMQASRYLLVMELASRGSLLDHLRHKRTDKTNPLRIQEVMKFAEQIALGMEHLVNQQCVHCDLAARNVLITEDFILKISDFGLARKLYSGIYVKDRTKKVRLPVRWMAPESMTELKFSSQSDVWSYGVLIWEIYQLGAVPYTGIPAHKLCMLIQQGLRLEKPQDCSEHHYQLMLSCWHDNPSRRPTFTTILQDLSQLKTTDSIVYINWNDDDYYSDCSDTSVTSSVENFCPVHGKSSTAKDHPAVKRNVNMKRKDSGLPDSPNEPFACKKDLQCDKSSHVPDETDI